jgi:endonuclease III
MDEPPDLTLSEAIDQLALLYPVEPPMTDPLALIVCENIGYLIPDDKRAHLFERLTREVGLSAAALVGAPETALYDIAEQGGMRPADRVEKLRRIGHVALEAGGDLFAALKPLSTPKRRALLKQFPGFGDPGADKVLLFSGLEVRPAADSNGVRALVRLGYAVEGSSYGQTYRSSTDALKTLDADRDRLIQAFQTLRAHGQALCKRTAPICEPCPLDAACAHVTVRAL